MIHGVEISRPRTGDADELARNLRPRDAEEVAALGYTPAESVRLSLAASAERYAVRIHGELACLFGVCEIGGSLIGGRDGLVWLLGTDVITRYPKAFWQASKLALPVLLKRWRTLTAWVHAPYVATLRWATRLGGEVSPAFAVKPHGELFHRVTFSEVRSWA